MSRHYWPTYRDRRLIVPARAAIKDMDPGMDVWSSVAKCVVAAPTAGSMRAARAVLSTVGKMAHKLN